MSGEEDVSYHFTGQEGLSCPPLHTQAAVFKPLLVLADLHPPLVHGVLPVALRAVEEVEGGRGCGKDASLRYVDVALS